MELFFFKCRTNVEQTEETLLLKLIGLSLGQCWSVSDKPILNRLLTSLKNFYGLDNNSYLLLCVAWRYADLIKSNEMPGHHLQLSTFILTFQPHASELVVITHHRQIGSVRQRLPKLHLASWLSSRATNGQIGHSSFFSSQGSAYIIEYILPRSIHGSNSMDRGSGKNQPPALVVYLVPQLWAARQT